MKPANVNVFWAIALLSGLLFGLSSCSDDGKLKSLTFDQTEMRLNKGESITLTLSSTPSFDLSYAYWRSSDETVATVSSQGVVTAVSDGCATITAEIDPFPIEARCVVTVDLSVPRAVDLGLSVKWASFNLGASTPEDYGNYYAWGETEKKKFDDSSNYRYGDDKEELDLEDDVAHMLLGGTWRMPTKAEFEELADEYNCFWEWTEINGVKGYKVSARTIKYMGNWIFLPAAGYRDGYALRDNQTGLRYWSSSLSTYSPKDAYCLREERNWPLVGESRYLGLSVRPVTE